MSVSLDCLSIISAANLLQSMDRTVDPCEDFYTFSCGNWADEHPTPETAVEHNWFAERTRHVMRRIRGEYQHFLWAARFLLIGGKWELLNIKIYLSYMKQFISHLAGEKSVHSFTSYSEIIAFCSKNHNKYHIRLQNCNVEFGQRTTVKQHSFNFQLLALFILGDSLHLNFICRRFRTLCSIFIGGVSRKNSHRL